MALYFHTTTFEVKEINPERYAAWEATGNPKASVYVPMPPQPAFDAQTQKAPVWEGGQWVIINKTPEEQAAASRKVWPTSADYLIEFTFQEMAAISLSQDPTVAALRLLLASWAGEVWSDDQRVQTGVQALVATGIITQERADEILTK